ncbi:MAG: hypothetical protein MUE44_32185 [Oscillatoriaceae cyanobacterium Prado104]|nr:hypothetical protein [Oscillatoriaceae cyanobacterium Prado104]
MLIEAPSQTLDLRDYPDRNREHVLNYIQQYSSIAPKIHQRAIARQNSRIYLLI